MCVVWRHAKVPPYCVPYFVRFSQSVAVAMAVVMIAVVVLAAVVVVFVVVVVVPVDVVVVVVVVVVVSVGIMMIWPFEEDVFDFLRTAHVSGYCLSDTPHVIALVCFAE
jgi:hypothetical protein